MQAKIKSGAVKMKGYVIKVPAKGRSYDEHNRHWMQRQPTLFFAVNSNLFTNANLIVSYSYSYCGTNTLPIHMYGQ